MLIGGEWVESDHKSTFTSENPSTKETVGTFPISSWADVDRALDEAVAAYRVLESLGPVRWSQFLQSYADEIEEDGPKLIDVAAAETALPAAPRLADVELPRTTNQLRLAAKATKARVWRWPVISPSVGIAAYRAPIPGAVVVFGPNNFPFAFNAVGGGDFAAAVATGHPVIAKVNPGHPSTSQLLAQAAMRAAIGVGIPASVVQVLYDLRPEDGLRLVADPRVAVTAFTGSRKAGLALKSAADQAGRPAYFEMGSPNPVVVLPRAWDERSSEIAAELANSVLMGGGQFCTKPGLILIHRDQADAIAQEIAAAMSATPPQSLLGESVVNNLRSSVKELLDAGAVVVHRDGRAQVSCSYPTTLLRVDADTFRRNPSQLQTEAFGNVSQLVVWSDVAELIETIDCLQGSLTVTVYSAAADEESYRRIVPRLREKGGRLVENKPPTGVAVVAAMNHGGPYPATSHPGFTSVGIPASLDRFTMLQSFDNVSDAHLPPELQASNPLHMERFVDGRWTDQSLT